MSRFSDKGLSLLEIIVGIAIGAICLLSFIASSGKIQRGRVQNITKTKALAAAATVIEDVRRKSWDEKLVAYSTRAYLSDPDPTDANNVNQNASRIEADGGETTPDKFDDVDDYNDSTITNGPFQTTVRVRYANAPFNGGTATSITEVTADNGLGTNAANRRNFKLITVTTTWSGAGSNVILKTLVANGRQGHVSP